MIAEEKINSILKENRKEFSKRDRGVAIRLDEDEAAFAQVNSGQNEQLKKIIADWMDEIPHDVVLELYAGSGNFTFALASKAKYIVASDIDGRAIKIAWKKQQVAKVCNVEFVCAPAARAAKRLHDPCDLILVDPPRKGCDDAINDIVAIKPKSILYVSCDPATLARDALSLSKHGYKMKKSLPIDMFPQTFHVESLSLFVR